ncbi:hypothetical protein WJT86_12045 [Microvirga sp. W0021]|uniref:Uncharacterized protein n=1 Tax=Hohaiivirga grylli TaxID=3133970 RepID=A0ABV0BLK2_9HYPH
MLEFSVGSSMNRDDLYVELSYDYSQWGEIAFSEDNGKLSIIIYLEKDKKLKFEYDEFITFLEKAKKRLLQVEGLK